MSSSHPKLVQRSRGFALLTAVVVFILIAAFYFGSLQFGTTTSESDRVVTTQKNSEAAKAIVLDYVRQYGFLPSIAEFQARTVGLTDAWGRPFLYFPSGNLTSGDISGVTTTFISVTQCGNDAACSAPTTISNIPFLVVSGGANAPLGGAIAQTSVLTTSTVIGSPTTFRQYRVGLDVGPYAAPTDPPQKRPYDDQLLIAALPDVFLASPVLTKSKGDALISGGSLKILNTDAALAPPPVYCGTPFSKTLLAHGMDSGTFSWSVTNLAPGLSANNPGGKSVVISGTPNVAGTYTVNASITDPNSRQASQSYSLTIISPGWSDIVPPSTRTLSCAVGLLGSIAQKQQTDSCDQTQWITTADTCQNTSTVDLRFLGTTLIAAGASAVSTDTGMTSLTIGSGTGGFIATGSSNISRSGIATTSGSIGVVGGASDLIDPGESISILLTGGAARTAGIEFRGLGIKASGADTIEEAIVTLTNTVVGMTVATYTLNACLSDSGTIRSTFFLPDPGIEFNLITITANGSPANTDFFIRTLRFCGVAASCTPTDATGAPCPFP